MSWLLKAGTSSIGKKQAMALTGLGLCAFLVVHMSGNFLLFAGPEKFNGYANYLEHHPLLIPAEIGLALLFLVHIVLAARVTLENRRARPVRYAVQHSEGGRSFASSTMWISGAVTLVFLILHLKHFKFGGEAKTANLHLLVVTTFHSVPYVVGYVAAVSILGLHVGHGVQSAFRTLGIDHPRFNPLIRWGSCLFGVYIAVGYASLPIWAYLATRSPA